MRILVLYVIFAAISTVANLGGQEVAIRMYSGPWGVELALAFGTGVGLVVKYLLDKKCIFRYVTKNAAHDGKLFLLYTTMGLATTAVFWGAELGAQAIWATKEARYTGGALGLALGYWIKYNLDKRYVFGPIK